MSTMNKTIAISLEHSIAFQSYFVKLVNKYLFFVFDDLILKNPLKSI